MRCPAAFASYPPRLSNSRRKPERLSVSSNAWTPGRSRCSRRTARSYRSAHQRSEPETEYPCSRARGNAAIGRSRLDLPRCRKMPGRRAIISVDIAGGNLEAPQCRIEQVAGASPLLPIDDCDVRPREVFYAMDALWGLPARLGCLLPRWRRR